MKKALSTLLLVLVVMSFAASVSAHDINQDWSAPQCQMRDAQDGPPPMDPPPAPHPHKHHKPAPPAPPAPPEPPQPDPHF